MSAQHGCTKLRAIESGLGQYMADITVTKLAEVVGLDPSNACRRRARPALGTSPGFLEAFDCLPLLGILRDDTAKGGPLLDAVTRYAEAETPAGSGLCALGDTKEAMRRLLTSTQAMVEALHDDRVDPEEAAALAANLRLLGIAAKTWLPNLDARAAEAHGGALCSH